MFLLFFVRFVSLTRGVVFWSVVCDCGVSCCLIVIYDVGLEIFSATHLIRSRYAW